MEAPDFKTAAGTAVRKVREAGKVLQKHPALALATAVAVGFLAGLVLRRFEGRGREEK